MFEKINYVEIHFMKLSRLNMFGDNDSLLL